MASLQLPEWKLTRVAVYDISSNSEQIHTNVNQTNTDSVPVVPYFNYLRHFNWTVNVISS